MNVKFDIPTVDRYIKIVTYHVMATIGNILNILSWITCIKKRILFLDIILLETERLQMFPVVESLLFYMYFIQP